MAKPLPMAAVVLPTASSLSVAFADFRRQLGHFGNPTGVVRDRPVGVDSQLDTCDGEHADGRDGDAVETGKVDAHR